MRRDITGHINSFLLRSFEFFTVTLWLFFHREGEVDYLLLRFLSFGILFGEGWCLGFLLFSWADRQFSLVDLFQVADYYFHITVLLFWWVLMFLLLWRSGDGDRFFFSACLLFLLRWLWFYFYLFFFLNWPLFFLWSWHIFVSFTFVLCLFFFRWTLYSFGSLFIIASFFKNLLFSGGRNWTLYIFIFLLNYVIFFITLQLILLLAFYFLFFLTL